MHGREEIDQKPAAATPPYQTFAVSFIVSAGRLNLLASGSRMLLGAAMHPCCIYALVSMITVYFLRFKILLSRIEFGQ